jgi:multiple sugar transport system permease protein
MATLARANTATTSSRQTSRMLTALACYVFISLLGLVMIYLLVWLVASSFKDSSEIFTHASSLIPQQFAIDNYWTGWAGFGGISLLLCALANNQAHV